MGEEDRHRLEGLPWDIQLEEWERHGVPVLVVRRGDSRHPVIFVERQGARYAIKETTPRMAEREIRNLQEIEQRGIPALSPIGTVLVSAPPIAIEVPGLKGMRQYISGDRGYTVTRLAPRVVPHVLLYRLPLTKRTKQRMLSAVAVLMVELHEHGVYWGDPSLANALIRIDGKQILSIMADAETVELFPGPISEGLREQDLAQFGESLAWQAEDLRQAKGLPEDVQVLDDADYRYFCQRYRTVRREHSRVTGPHDLNTIYHTQRLFRAMGDWRDVLAEKASSAMHQITPILPGWYQQTIYELLHVTIPRAYARRFYNLIVGHQAIMSKNEQREVSIEEAAQDWYEKYHLPTILMLRQRLTSEQDPMQAYFAIMQHKWEMSLKAGYEIPLDEAILDWELQTAQTGKLGPVDPAAIATWWRHRQPVATVLEPPMIESEDLDPLLSTAERPLVHMDLPQLEQELPKILHKENEDEE
ncbi:DUF4032 domain-containing protein [Dictyobacter formicarum]|uniref:DUF4032 domain-containing protein n=1 Tax=Dictyobacter formicarum TaxID=2778368 RepID=A0ABQ3VKP9_9CHLR|nr:DUF4032 domain-containing protein [Dictyobacter formicarum]GHO86241.1 hypothetical protein KSZ_42470 [Dictyobacter formicarum]